MRVFICLSIFCFVLATCQFKCFSDPLRPLLKDGKGVKPNTCVDRYDGKTHPIRSSWSTAHCFVCECSPAGMQCCERDRGIIILERCKKGENPESCDNGALRLDGKCRIILHLDITKLGIIPIRERHQNKYLLKMVKDAK
ncbi:small serum protein 3-like [Pantherophis guttatus]|uniref:Small serum protein 3-like n=1 Tax=Pantherophis guttatus TaxID=94885 RepID=A0ABM3YT96_PANGU|nr:small serum protein 3-like [Pantherophis guttatus]